MKRTILYLWGLILFLQGILTVGLAGHVSWERFSQSKESLAMLIGLLCVYVAKERMGIEDESPAYMR